MKLIKFNTKSKVEKYFPALVPNNHSIHLYF